MKQFDFIGQPETPPQSFRDIRNTRPSVAEEKAQLTLILGRLCASVPHRVRNGSVNLTRDWMAAQKAAKSLAANSRASVLQLSGAIGAMRRFESE